MEFYVKRDGKLVKATQEEILSTDAVLYNASGKCLDDSPAAPESKNDPIAELTGLVREMATTANESFTKITDGLKEREDKMMAELAAFKETARKGLPLPAGDGDGRNVAIGRGMIPYADGDDELCAPFNLAVQGQKIFDKLHNSPKIAEERRKTIA